MVVQGQASLSEMIAGAVPSVVECKRRRTVALLPDSPSCFQAHLRPFIRFLTF